MPLTESEVAQQVCRFETSIKALLEENKSKSINILWSGGCDSTLILYWLLEWLKNLNDDRTHTVYVMFYEKERKIGYTADLNSRILFSSSRITCVIFLLTSIKFVGL